MASWLSFSKATGRSVGLIASCGILGAAIVRTPAPAQGSKKKKAAAQSQTATKSSYVTEIKPLIDKYCGACHYDEQNSSGDVYLKGFTSMASIQAKGELWSKVSKNVSSLHMPPQGSAMPTPAQRQKIVDWIETSLSANCSLSEPGRVTMRRLNREEYNNSIRDLLGVEMRPADDFPTDDVGHGFDNMGDVLSVSPLLMEKYLSAAERIAEATIAIPVRIHEIVELSSIKVKSGTLLNGELVVATNDTASVPVNLPRSGQYNIKIRLYGQQAGPAPVKSTVSFEGIPLQELDIPQTRRDPLNLKYTVEGRSGMRHIQISYNNDFYDATAPKGKQDRNLVIAGVEIEGPLDGGGPVPPSHRRVIPVDPTPENEETVARTSLQALATKAYRRPATTEDVDRLVGVYRLGRKTGEGFERSMQLALEAVLVSPRFIYRIEADNTGTRALDSYEMASRLSYFLWSSMPDEELINLAKANKLQDSKVLAMQVKRMLQDPKSRAMTDNFAGQWLNLRLLDNINPDTALYPDWSEKLRSSMLKETKMFFEGVKSENRSVLDFLTGKFSYINETLAKHYGIEGVEGDEFRKVALTNPNRAGILTQGAILTLTSNPTRTSPVKRGKWVLEQILGTPPPPPPPGVPDLKDNKGNDANLTVRQRLEEHRKNPACASCHAAMDPLGFGLENFDAVGRWRSTDGGKPIDSTGVLPGGKKFSGPGELRTVLMTNRGQFVKSLSEKMLTYALGRGLTLTDKCATDSILKASAADAYRFSSIVTGVVLSEPFRKRKGEGVSK